MSRVTACWVVLAACGQTPSTQHGPPPAFDLSAPTTAARGEDITLTATLPVPLDGIRVSMVRATGGSGVACLGPRYGRPCMDITGAIAIVGRPNTTGGVAELIWNVPPTAPSPLLFQAVVLHGSNAYFSNPIDIGVRAADPPRVADFDGDGFGDLAVGVPYEDAGATVDAGLVHLAYGSAFGPITTRDVLLEQTVLGGPDFPQAGDRFGLALAHGDFDGDGFDDLVVSAPDDDVQGSAGQGVVSVVYGGPNGLRTAMSIDLSLGAGGLAGPLGDHARFGEALAVGNFDGDAYHDLAIGVPGGDVAGLSSAGFVRVLYGSASGLGSEAEWSQAGFSVPDTPEAGDRFGSALAAGDYDGDGFDDLAVGAPSEEVDGIGLAGSVTVFYGSAVGIDDLRSHAFDQNDPDIAGTAASYELFGATTRSGDFDGDGFDDLAIAATDQAVGGHQGAGEVIVVYGTSSGLAATGSDRFDEDSMVSSSGPTGGAGHQHHFGAAMAVGDFDDDGRDDLAIAAPMSDAEAPNGGWVKLIHGRRLGLRGPVVEYAPETWAVGIIDATDYWFGHALAVADFIGDGDDLAIGVPRADVTVDDEGEVVVIPGAGGMLETDANAAWHLHQDQPGAEGIAQPGDRYGLALP